MVRLEGENGVGSDISLDVSGQPDVDHAVLFAASDE